MPEQIYQIMPEGFQLGRGLQQLILKDFFPLSCMCTNTKFISSQGCHITVKYIVNIWI